MLPATLLLTGLLGGCLAVPAPKDSRALFSVVKFPNDACASSTSLTGTCLTSSECTTAGGSADGNCAAGFGVCCLIVSATCETSTAISSNNTYLRNPGYSSTYPTSTSAKTCSYKISKADTTVCQLRLDFHTLTLGQTASSGACTDSFAATTTADNSATTSYPAVCGTSVGHHMYLDLGSSSSTASATITISLAASSASAKWNILVQQIDCDTLYTAPEGCTMYLTGATGSWSSYGYTGTTTTEHPQNQNYNVCIRRESGYCSIRHSAATSTSFSLSGIANAVQTTAKSGSTNCYTDFITIPSGSLDGTQQLGVTTTGPAGVDRYCGVKLGWTDTSAVNQPIISTVLPFTVGVRMDNTDGGSTPFGVSLNYQQLPC